MTNKEYMLALPNNELAVYLRSEPWSERANELWRRGWTSYDDGIERWLEEECEYEKYSI